MLSHCILCSESAQVTPQAEGLRPCPASVPNVSIDVDVVLSNVVSRHGRDGIRLNLAILRSFPTLMTE